jgi:hypothetical protein
VVGGGALNDDDRPGVEGNIWQGARWAALIAIPLWGLIGYLTYRWWWS